MAEKKLANATEARHFIVERTLDAPRELVFQAFSQATHLAHWWGPVGFKIVVKKLEFRPGGIFHYCMQSPDRKNDMWGKFVYDEISAPEKISFINSFADEDGNIIPPPFDSPWPKEIYNECTFTAKGNTTLLTLHAYPVRANEEECNTFLQGFPSMEEGYGGTFDALETYLTKVIA
jgi:uncharacterized protein YndB with AHSA1/START domain